MAHEEFLQRYRALVPRSLSRLPPGQDKTKALIATLPSLHKSECQAGVTKVFMKNGVFVCGARTN